MDPRARIELNRLKVLSHNRPRVVDHQPARRIRPNESGRCLEAFVQTGTTAMAIMRIRGKAGGDPLSDKLFSPLLDGATKVTRQGPSRYLK
jgi:hypothetical protein